MNPLELILKRNSQRVLLCIGVLSVVMGCNNPRQLSETERAQRAFMRHCSSCHGGDGRGRPMPGLQAQPQNLADPEFQRSRSDAQLREVLLNGKGAMPPLGRMMSEAELAEMIRFLRTLPTPAQRL